MAFLPLLLTAALLGLWFLSTKIMQTTLAVLGDPRDRITERLYPPPIEELRAPLKAVDTWAREHDYVEDTLFDFWTTSKEQSLFCQTWKNSSEHTYLVFYFGLGKHFIELVTIYDDKTGVTTTNSPDGHTLPAAPGAFIQTFPDTDLPTLLERHLDGRHTLERRTGLMPQDRPETTIELITTSLKRQASYVTSIPGWKWKGIWWLTVRKRQMTGKNVAWQLDQFGVHEPTPPTATLQ